MEKSKLKQVIALLDQADRELTESFENDGMDEYDYYNAIVIARNFISKARELVVDTNNESKETS